jgi:hypothetical protein
MKSAYEVEREEVVVLESCCCWGARASLIVNQVPCSLKMLGAPLRQSGDFLGGACKQSASQRHPLTPQASQATHLLLPVAHRQEIGQSTIRANAHVLRFIAPSLPSSKAYSSNRSRRIATQARALTVAQPEPRPSSIHTSPSPLATRLCLESTPPSCQQPYYFPQETHRSARQAR